MMVMQRLDPQQFRQLAGGTLAQRGEALKLLVAHGIAYTESIQDETVVHFMQPDHPCAVIYRGTRSRQGVQP